MATVTKADLAEAMSREAGMPIAETRNALQILIETMKEAVEKDASVMLHNFGIIEMKEKRERKGRNPQTGEPITLSGRNVILFRVSRNFRKRLDRIAEAGLREES